jgi:hypothetical protein
MSYRVRNQDPVFPQDPRASRSPGRNRSSQPGGSSARKALRIRCMNGMEVRKKRPRGFKKEAQGVEVSPLNPLSVAPCKATQ